MSSMRRWARGPPFIADSRLAKRILDHLGIASQVPPRRPVAAVEPPASDPFPDHAIADPSYND